MTAPKYSTNGTTYIDIPKAMLAGTYAGQFELIMPQPTTFDLAGQPAGAFGKPKVVLRSDAMPSTSMASWMGIMNSDLNLAQTIYIDAWNPYRNQLTRVEGTLLRPEWERVQSHNYGVTAIYQNVEIEIVNCTEVSDVVPNP